MELVQDVFQVVVEGNENKQTSIGDDGDDILGELLGYLRENKLMSTLMLCRQIEKIDVKSGVCELSAVSGDISELFANEKHKQELEKFFKGKGLGFKIQENIKTKSKVDLLCDIFGNKLIVQ